MSYLLLFSPIIIIIHERQHACMCAPSSALCVLTADDNARLVGSCNATVVPFHRLQSIVTVARVHSRVNTPLPSAVSWHRPFGTPKSAFSASGNSYSSPHPTHACPSHACLPYHVSAAVAVAVAVAAAAAAARARSPRYTTDDVQQNVAVVDGWRACTNKSRACWRCASRALRSGLCGCPSVRPVDK